MQQSFCYDKKGKINFNYWHIKIVAHHEQLYIWSTYDCEFGITTGSEMRRLMLS